MPSFRIHVEGERLQWALMALNSAGIPTLGVFPAFWVANGPPPSWGLEGLSAVVEAETPDHALERVKENLPADIDLKLSIDEQFEGA